MKDKINEILLNNIHPGNGVFDEGEATEQLARLMSNAVEKEAKTISVSSHMFGGQEVKNA